MVWAAEGITWVKENAETLARAGMAVYLVLLSVPDIRSRRLDVRWIVFGLLYTGIMQLLILHMSAGELLAGAGVGIVFLLVSRLGKESFGYGDSLLITVLGCFLGFWDVMTVLLGAFAAAAVFGLGMMLCGKFNRKSAFPFVPFLAAAYAGELLAGVI